MKHASKYNDWKEEYNWGTCKLNNREFGKFISTYLRSSSRLVANLDSAWGSGKTNFLKRLYVDLAENNHPAIYIDAWESDYSKNPLSVISAELFQQLSVILTKPGTDLQKVTDSFNRALSFAKPVAELLSIFGEGSENYQQASKLINATPKLPKLKESESLISQNNTLIEKVKNAHFEQIKAMRDLKEQLALVASVLESVYELEMPVIVLIDELDRCRPNYAIEFLEVIKHFFEIGNFVFLCASDTKQLCASIKTIYGNEFDSETYIKRFFERTIALPKPSISGYIKSRNVLNHESKSITLHPCLGEGKIFIEIITNLIELISEEHGSSLSLRDVDQILAKYESIIYYLESLEDNFDIDIVVVFTLLCMYQIGKAKKIPPVLHSANDVKFYGESLKALIDNQFSLVKETLSTIRYYGAGSFSEVSDPMIMLVYQSQESENQNVPVFRESTKRLLTNYEQRVEQNTKYFLLDDYIKLANLSGAIL